MKAQRWEITLFFFLSLFFLTQCGKDKGGGNADLSGGGDGLSGTTTSGNFSSDGNIDPTAGYDDLSDALGQLPAESPEKQQAISGAQEALATAMDAYGSLQPGDSPTDVQKFIESIERFRSQAAAVAQLLAAAGFPQLADVFKKMAAKVDVMRFYDPQSQRHTFVAASTQAFVFSILFGYKYQGIAFRVFKTSQLDPGCRVPLYSCQAGSDNFLSNRQDCEGKRTIREMGFVCSKAGDLHPLPLARLLRNGQDHHLSTMNPQEIRNKVQSGAWKFERYQGFPVF